MASPWKSLKFSVVEREQKLFLCSRWAWWHRGGESSLILEMTRETLCCPRGSHSEAFLPREWSCLFSLSFLFFSGAPHTTFFPENFPWPRWKTKRWNQNLPLISCVPLGRLFIWVSIYSSVNQNKNGWCKEKCFVYISIHMSGIILGSSSEGKWYDKIVNDRR